MGMKNKNKKSYSKCCFCNYVILFCIVVYILQHFTRVFIILPQDIKSPNADCSFNYKKKDFKKEKSRKKQKPSTTKYEGLCTNILIKKPNSTQFAVGHYFLLQSWDA